MRNYRLVIMAILLMIVGRAMSDNLTVETVTMSSGETKQVTIGLSNPTYKYVAFQFDLILPKGVTIAKDSKGKLITSLNNDRKDDHSLNVAELGSGGYRFLTFSMSNAEFYGTSGPLVYMTLQAADTISEGYKTATIKSQVFTKSSGEQAKWGDKTFSIQIQPAIVPVITADNKTREYGDANPTLTYQTSSSLTGVPTLTTTATKTSPVGTYEITVGKGTVQGNYTAVNGTLTITKAPLTISGGTYTIKQGETLPTFTATYSGFKNGETSAVLTRKPTLTTTATSSSAPGTYDVIVSGAEAQNYSMEYVKGTLTITKADAVTVTARNYTREYGEANPTFGYDVSGATLTGVPEISCSATTTSPVGTYPIVIKKGSVTNYNDTYVNGTLTITKAPLTISGGTYTMKQGEPLPTFMASYSGFKNGETSAVLTRKPTLTTTATSSSGPGTYDVIVSGAEAQNYSMEYVKGTLTITEADAVIVTAMSYTREYGEDNPWFDYYISGATLDGMPEISCEATATSPVGTYPIVIKKGSVTNYNDTYINGTLTITKAPLTIKAGTYTRKQGEDNPSFTLSYEGFKNGETEAVLTQWPTVTTDATKDSPVGDYDVRVYGATAQNYAISYIYGTLRVTQADAVIVTARNYTREYGEANPTFGYDVSGAALDGVPEISCEATSTSPVGTYPIVIKKGSVTNYNDTYINGTLTITKAPLTIKAGTYTRKQGEDNPSFTLSYEGFKNGETESVLTQRPTVTTSATKESPVGDYEVRVYGAAAQNYAISYVNGTLKVTQADAVIVTARNYTREYGEANPTFGYDVSGVALTGVPEISCSATATSPVGTYPIIIKKGSVTNYNDTYINGTLTITKAPLTIKAGVYTRKQGEDNPAFKLTYEGFKNGETESVLTQQPTITTSATKESPVGDYEVRVYGANAQNYSLSYVNGTLRVTQADAVIVTARNYTREYGDANPAFGYDVSGAALTGVPEISCSATATSPVGTYPIIIKKGSVTNYNDTYINGTLTITKAQLTITAKSYSRKQGEENPTFEATYEGFKNNETASVLTKKPTLTTTAKSSSEPGTYIITASDAEAQNYNILYVNGTLTVTQADAVTVTAISYTREYGDANPTFSYTVTGAALNGKPSISCSATATSPVGTYPIVITVGTVKNYNVQYVNGTLTITRAPLTVTAKSYTRKQGESNPTFDATYSGFKNKETSSVLTKKPSFTTTATADSRPGTYDIVVYGAEAQNYEFSYVKGILTITEREKESFTIGDISYTGTNASLTAEVTQVGEVLKNVEIPSSVTYDGKTYSVTSISSSALNGLELNYLSVPASVTTLHSSVFSDCRLAALIWNANSSLSQYVFSYAKFNHTSNFLLYVNADSYAPSNVKNVVSGTTAKTVVLSDDGENFYCPREFTAQSISYTHHYGMTTGGAGKGWETLSLPFDVQKIEHRTKGELTPFAAYAATSSQHPFWLYEFGNSGFRRASNVRANTPYIISMPNEPRYDDEFIMAGDVTFSSTNAKVAVTNSLVTVTSGSMRFVPAFSAVERSATVYPLNVNNSRTSYTGAYNPGSRFVSNLRQVYPFEAYMSTSSSNVRESLPIEFEDEMTGIDEIPCAWTDSSIRIFTLGGQKVVKVSEAEFEKTWQQLPAGVYIVNGKKVVR